MVKSIESDWHEKYGRFITDIPYSIVQIHEIVLKTAQQLAPIFQILRVGYQNKKKKKPKRGKTHGEGF